MAFDDYGSQAQNGSTQNNRPEIDYNALNKYLVETIGCEQPETYNGFISNIVDLGTQKQPLAEYALDAEDVGLSIAELNEKHKDQFVDENADDKANHNKIVKFEEVFDNQLKMKVLKKLCFQQPRQSIAYSVDFPDIQVDLGQFFGYAKDENENDIVKTTDLRLYFGGEWYQKSIGKKVIQNLIPLKRIKDDKIGWTMNPKSAPYKMALASEIIKTGEPFLPNEIDKLLGKTLQFQVQVSGKEVNGRYYLQERLKFVGKIQKKDKPFEDVEATLIQFNQENDLDGVRKLRQVVINTLTQATNFKGSAIETQLKEVKPFLFDENGEVKGSGAKVQQPKADNAKTTEAYADDDF